MQLIVASAYQVCAQQFDATATTGMAQQIQLLLQQVIKNPNPRKQFISNFVQHIQQWRNQDKEILIGMDANKNVEDPNAKDLIDLHHPAKSKLATHQCGSYPIDMMLGALC